MSDRGFEVDLTNCDREPIHLLGAIQPIGFLLVVTADWLVARASANVDIYVGRSADDLIGLPIHEVLDELPLHDLRNRMMLLQGDDAIERIFGLPLLANTPDRLFDCAIHMSGSHIVIEAEPSAPGDHPDAASQMRSAMARLDAAPDLRSYFRVGARQVRRLTGFDRVMVYRFDRDGSGEVVAEAARSGIGSFLGLHYPASDIPQQARELYLRTPFRVIADIGAPPVPIIPPRDENGASLDLSLSVLRSVSPIHIEYLKNMGVGASLSISIIVDGKLWGLFACHHYSPNCPPFSSRTLAELFGQMFALKLESRSRREAATYETAARGANDRLLAAVASNVGLLDDPDWVGDTLRSIIPCNGVAIWMDGKVARGGLAPPAEDVPQIVRRLNAMASGRIFATDQLARFVPGAEKFAAVAAGLLAIPISRSPRDYVLLFRQEKIRTVTWAGDPGKPATYGPNGARLTPRESFAEWGQEVRGRCEPFSDAEVRVAETLRASLIEVVLRLSDAAEAERRRAAERQELLIAELNHRVRNILALIRGLVRQTRGPRKSSTDYIELLEGRIEALARAHDQITQDNWGPARLRPMIETEAAAYLAGNAGRVRIDGEPILLEPAAYSTMALVVHELMTNSAKYGALSDSGGVRVSWSLDGIGSLVIDWVERGGPAVKPPTRQGFGTTIIERSIPYDLGGTAELHYRTTGLEARFVIPSRHIRLVEPGVAATPPHMALDTTAGVNDALLKGTVLLVEDNLIITMDAEDILLRLGADNVVAAATIAQALEAIEREPPDFALLDVNLGHETSLPIADRLRAAGVPYIFATGYGDQLNLPPEHAGALIAQKPYTAASITALLHRR
ncbi:MAG: GAF domain-containing protein [Alphaproteobacteria bacterium]|nr:GAF domain-containing protein [Alphaproteobacteria bacterium]